MTRHLSGARRALFAAVLAAIAVAALISGRFTHRVRATAQPAAAVPYFERAISQAPRAVAARYGLTRAVVALGDHARAERELAALRALDPRAAALAEGARR